MISSELATFFESGLSVLVGTRDARLFPDSTRAIAARVEPDREDLTVFLPDATSRTALANLRENGRIAVCFGRPRDHRTIQVKGRIVALGAAAEADRALIDRYRAGVAQELGFIGLPPRLTFRMANWPCHAARLRVESVYVQTPGPGAGAPLGGTTP